MEIYHNRFGAILTTFFKRLFSFCDVTRYRITLFNLVAPTALYQQMGDKLIGGRTQYKTFHLWERPHIVYKLTDHYALRASIPF